MNRKRYKVITIMFVVMFVLSICVSGIAAPSATPSATPSASQSATPSATQSAAPSATQSAAPSATQSAAPTNTALPSEAPTNAPPFFSDDIIPIQADIEIITQEDLQKIGIDAAYPIDGAYALKNDIDCKNAEMPSIVAFSGTFNGNGHKLSNLQIAGNGLFTELSGVVRSLDLSNITVKTKGEAPTGVLAGSVSGEAQIEDLFITGKIELLAPTQEEQPTEPTYTAGGMAGSVQGAKSVKNVAAFVEIVTEGKLAGALVGDNAAPQEIYTDCLWSACYGQATAFGIDSKVNETEGAAKLQTAPTYLALMGTQSGSLTANTETAARYGMTFKEFSLAEQTILNMAGMGNTVDVTPKGEMGADAVYAAYEKTYTDNTKEVIRFSTPVIVSKDINETKPLEPVDSIFPTQIEEAKPLEPIDAVFPMQLNANEATVTLTNWEQFKNIGNTDYNKAYTMSANYVLAGDITADEEPFTPIGTEENPFTGTFDGKTFNIDVSKNTSINQDTNYYGLFGVVKQP
ncbi:MAG: hypothetical protein RR797_04145 [Christensenella sp.]